MNAAWIILGLGVLGAITAMIGRSQGRGQQSNLGSVSQQWVAEHRLSQTPDSQR